MRNTVLYILGLMCGVGIGGIATFFSTDIIIKVYLTKKYGDLVEATVVKAKEVNAKGNITYNVDCEFEYNGRTIQKSSWGMREKDVFSAEYYIGKKYMVYYYSKYDYMVIKQEYKKALQGGIMGVIFSGMVVIISIIIVLGDMGYIKF